MEGGALSGQGHVVCRDAKGTIYLVLGSQAGSSGKQNKGEMRSA